MSDKDLEELLGKIINAKWKGKHRYRQAQSDLERALNWFGCEIESHDSQDHHSTCIGDDLEFKLHILQCAIKYIVDVEMNEALRNGEFEPQASEQWYKDTIQKIRDETGNRFIEMMGRPEEYKREINEAKDTSRVPHDCFGTEQ